MDEGEAQKLLNQVRNLLFMLPKEQKISFVNTTTYKTGMVHTYLTSLSTDQIVTISNDIENYIDQTSNGQLKSPSKIKDTKKKIRILIT